MFQPTFERALRDLAAMRPVTLVEVGERVVELHYDGHPRIPLCVEDYVRETDWLAIHDFTRRTVQVSYDPAVA